MKETDIILQLKIVKKAHHVVLKLNVNNELSPIMSIKEIRKASREDESIEYAAKINAALNEIFNEDAEYEYYCKS